LLIRGKCVGTNNFHFMRGFGLSLAALGAAITAPAHAGAAPAQAKAAMVSALAFIAQEDLEFGYILPSATAGTVTVSPANVRTSTGGVTLMSGGLVQPSRFFGKGTFGQFVQISLASSPFVLTRSGGTETMILDTMVIGSTPTAILTTAPLTFRIGSATGIFNFPLGGTLRVNANQVPGDYAGTITITLNYL
jgi:spore coat protein U-like protein